MGGLGSTTLSDQHHQESTHDRQPITVGAELICRQCVAKLGFHDHPRDRRIITPAILQIRASPVSSDHLGQPETASVGLQTIAPHEFVKGTGAALQTEEPADASSERHLGLDEHAIRHERCKQTVRPIGLPQNR